LPPEQEPQHVHQDEEPFEVELVAHEGQEPQGAPTKEHQQQNNDNDVDNKPDNEEYTPLCDSENEKLYHNADEFRSFGNEVSIPIDRLRALLGLLGITIALKFWIKSVPRLGRVEYRVIMEVFHRSNVVSRHMRSAFGASCNDDVADAA
jgi:hypothetical protein